MAPIRDQTPRAINDSGFVAGTDWPDGYGVPYIYNYRTSQITYLPDISDQDQEAEDINNFNQVVGYYEHAGGTAWSGFIWEGDHYTILRMYSNAYAINDSGVVVGEYDPDQPGRDTEPTHAFVYDPVRGLRDLNALIPPGTGWLLREARDINERGQIVGGGILNGVPKAFILTPNQLTVTQPSVGELFIAGETDTIKWIGWGDIGTLTIWLSIDYENKSGTFKLIADSIPANAAEYVWDVPDTILSRKCAIMVEDADDPTTFATSEQFKVKGYELARVPADGNYERYLPGKDSWRFANGDGINWLTNPPDITNAVMWPKSWWQQFDYANATDPYTMKRYPPNFARGFSNPKPSDFPDWPLWVEAYGVDECYFEFLGARVYRPSAVLFWAFTKGKWGGSCYGFAASSFLPFGWTYSFTQEFGLPSFGSLSELPLNDLNRKIINQLWIHQTFADHRIFRISGWSKSATEVLEQIKAMLLAEERDDRILNFGWLNPLPAAHSVNPYKVVKDASDPNIEYIYVYDNNCPSCTNVRFTIDKAANKWQYSELSGTYVRMFIYLDSPSSWFLSSLGSSTHSASETATIPKSAAETPYLEIYNTSEVAIAIADQAGNRIGLDRTGLLNTLPGGAPIVPFTGYNHLPIGYHVPEGQYSVQISDFPDSLVHFAVLADSSIFAYSRTDADSYQTDYLAWRDGLGVRSTDETKKFNLETIIKRNRSENVFDILDCQLLRNDSLHFKTANRRDLQVINTGSPKSYNLRVRLFSADGDATFEHANVSLAANASHKISPVWEDLENAPVQIYIDMGNDSTVDDSLGVENEATGVKTGSSGAIPQEYVLYQNYPNPFNATTQIRFTLPQGAHVSLTVYNALGKRVAVLVDERRAAGEHAVSFDGSAWSSGVYVYRLEAGAFVGTQKMLLIR